MSVKVKVFQVVAAYEEFAAILKEQDETKVLSTRAATYVRRAASRLEADYQTFNKTRMELFKEFGEEKDGLWAVTGEKLGAFMEKWKPIAEDEIEVDAFMLDLALFDGTNFSNSRIAAIESFIKVE